MAGGRGRRAGHPFTQLSGRSPLGGVRTFCWMAVSEGETAFVLYRNKTNQTMRVINPSTGITTNVTDPTGAMQQVWALFNQNDVIIY